MTVPLLEVSGLELELPRGAATITPVRGVSFSLARGEILGIAGESGAGKTLTLRSIIGLLPRGAEVRGGIRFSASGGPPAEYDPIRVRGRGISMVFQDSTTALNPTMRIGDNIAAAPRHHKRLTRSEAHSEALALMARVGIPEPERRARMWPHELSGGLRQRAMIAVALSAGPSLLLCDEPTTALDVSVQDQILGLLHQLRIELGMAMIFVSHDLAALAELSDRLLVMYAGQIVEAGPTDAILACPGHPYTKALLRAVPSFGQIDRELAGIPGQPPDAAEERRGCPFAPRCQFAADVCAHADMQLIWSADRATACVRPEAMRTRS